MNRIGTWLLFAGSEEDDQVLLHDELPHAGRNQFHCPHSGHSVVPDWTVLINVCLNLRLPSSASSWEKSTTWRRSKLFRNRTGATQRHARYQHLKQLVLTSGILFFASHHSHDAMDSFYDYIWDVTILEYLTRILWVFDVWFTREKTTPVISSLMFTLTAAHYSQFTVILPLMCVQTFTTNGASPRRDR